MTEKSRSHDRTGRDLDRSRPASAEGVRCPGNEAYGSQRYVADQLFDFKKQVITSLLGQLVELPRSSSAARFLDQEGLYFGPYADESDALRQKTVADAAAKSAHGISGFATHAFNGGAMKFMNTPAFDELRRSFGFSTQHKANFSDEQIANAVGLERSAKIMMDLVVSKPDIDTALMVMFPFEWPKFKAGYNGDVKP